MSLSALWALGPVVTPSGQINQISEQSVDPGIETLLECSDGQVDYTFAGVQFQRPMLSFSTTAVARALGYAGISGLAVSTALDMYFQKIAQGGTRSGGLTSTKFTATNGILVPKRISASHEGIARLDMEMAAISPNGTTAPLAVAVNQTMPSVVSTREYFTAGPVSVNGTTISGVTNIEIDLGLDLVIEGSDGEPYPTFSAIMKRKPTIAIRCRDVNVANTLAGFSVLQSAADSVVYLRKMAAGSTRVANATLEHIKFTVDDGMISVRPVGGDEKRPQEQEILIEPIFDGTNDVIAVSTASAIA